jgi:uncharacterized protein GlcG (DUF336 family)
MMRNFCGVVAAALILASCGGEGDGTSTAPSLPPTGPTDPDTPPYAAPAAESLSVADVEKILAGAIAEANARNLPAVIAVTDRVGNVLAVFRMNGARANAVASPAPNGDNIDVQGVEFPAEAGAIAKAITGAYLSSSGNAFSTRTASMIVQQHFPLSASTAGLESGPLFGVQFSQLPCSDLNTRFAAGGGGAAMIGPKRSPLGLSADAGGFPLYKNGVVVGGIGVMADGVYGSDANVADVDSDDEEFIALAATRGFEAPVSVQADRITVDGTTLRYSDATFAGVRTSGVNYASVNGVLGSPVAVRGYSDGAVVAGAVYGSEASGVRAATGSEFSVGGAFVLTNGAGANRYPVRAGTDAGSVAAPLSAAEVRAVLEEAYAVMGRARAQIRRPLNSRAEVTVSLVDTHGSVLGLVRSPDAPIFGTDVSLQKARSAAFLSNSRAASDLLGDPSPDVQSFVGAVRSFTGDAAALSGGTAYSARAIGNLARPYFPDGEVGRPQGPLSRPIAQFNPFSTGLQSALIIGNLGAHLAFVTGALADTPQQCTGLPDVVAGQNRLQNGLQIFPGGVPIYRGDVLVGAIGVSGDGIDQDDMISFLGLHNGAAKVGGISQAPMARRADNIVINVGAGVRLRYVQCPFNPFLGTSQQNVCQGL